MKKICAWCRKDMGNVSSATGSDNIITHCICEDCKDNLVFQRGVELGIFLDSLKLPIVIVDGGGTVISGNDKARSLLRKELSEIEGCKGGEVFECAYARLPEGCGNTVHCSGCAIRRTVMKTFGTGKSYVRIPASINQDSPDESERINLLISTERMADYVLLRIDEIERNDASQP